MTLLLAAAAVLLGTGSCALATSRWPRAATGIAALGAVAAAVLGLVPTLAVLGGRTGQQISIGWAVPAGAIVLGVDALTAFFLVPVLVLGAVCAVYGLSYMRGHRGLGSQAFFFNTTLAAMMLVLLARNAVVLLLAWEVMTIASYLLVSSEHHQAEVRRAGWVYLVAGHVGVAFLLALLLILGRPAGDYGFAAMAVRAQGGRLPSLVFALGLVGFGIKAGVVPLHVWLPEAHAAAPSPVSSLMSGALIKLGLYGVLRVATFLRPQAWWGPTLIVLGLAGGLLGISLACYQRDIKRVLAYSSVENVGIILVGLGVGYWGVTHGQARMAALGFYGALFHVWNHAASKGLLFLCAGGVLHATGSKDLERLGGLLRRMPWTGALTILGALAITGLPPLNGFASEWLIYMGLLGGALGATSGASLLLLFVAAGLAMIGVLAALCFVRLVGVGFLGQPRSAEADQAHDPGRPLVGPMLVLAAALPVMSLAAPRLVALLALPAGQLAGSPMVSEVASLELRPVVAFFVALLVAVVLCASVLGLAVRRRRASDETWGCGYLAPTPRMQYTGRSFAETIAERLLPPFFRARITIRRPTVLFPEAGAFSADCTDPLTRSAYQPFFDRWARRFSRLRWVQQGVLHGYLFYILLVVVAGLAWASARRWWWGQ